jgi:hypothetical protein
MVFVVYCFVPRNDGFVPRNDGFVPRNDGLIPSTVALAYYSFFPYQPAAW